MNKTECLDTVLELFPDDAEVHREIRENLKDEFELAHHLFEFAVGLFSNPIRPKRMSVVTANMGCALHVKACKQFRAIVATVELGCGGEAEILNRALLETALAMNFILRPRFRVCTLEKVNGKWRRAPGRSIHRNVRGMMGVVYALLQVDRNIARAKSTPKLKRPFRKSVGSWAPDLTQCENILGAETIRDLRKSSTCAGIPILDLAVSLGPFYQQLHGVFYGEQSRRAHPADILEHVDLDPNYRPVGKWRSTMEDCRWSLNVGILLLTTCLECECNYFEFDAAVRDELEGFGKELVAGRHKKV